MENLPKCPLFVFTPCFCQKVPNVFRSSWSDSSSRRRAGQPVLLIYLFQCYWTYPWVFGPCSTSWTWRSPLLLSLLMCFYCASCLGWHVCAPERTVGHKLQDDRKHWNWLVCRICDASHRTNTQLVFTHHACLREMPLGGITRKWCNWSAAWHFFKITYTCLHWWDRLKLAEPARPVAKMC